MNMEELNPLLAELGVGNKETFWKRTKSLGQHDTVKIKNLGSGENTINITGTQGQSLDDVPNQTGINAWDDEFEGSAIDSGGTRRTGAKAWTWFNQLAATVTQGQGRTVMRADYGVGDVIHSALLEDAPSAPWVFRAKVQNVSASHYTESNGGLLIYNSVNGKAYQVGFSTYHGGIAAISIGGLNGGGDAFTPGSAVHNSQGVPTYVELEHDGSDIIARASKSGADGDWITMATGVLAFTGTITHVGIAVGAGLGQADSRACFEWFRRVS